MAVRINSAADARYYAARANSSRTNSSTSAKKTSSSIISSMTKMASSLASTAKSVVKKNSSSATTATKKNNTNAAVNAASASVKSKTNQNKKTTTTVSSAVSKVASSISKAVTAATNAVKNAVKNTKTSTTKTASKTATSTKNTTNAKAATATNTSNTKKITSSGKKDLASSIISTVNSAASTVKKASSKVNTAVAAEKARQEATARAKAEEQAAMARAAAMAKSRPSAKATTSSAAVSVVATANKNSKNTAVSNKNAVTNTTVSPSAAKTVSSVKNNSSNNTITVTKEITAPEFKNASPQAIDGTVNNKGISDKDRINNAVSILAAKNAKIPVDSHGVPIINNGGDAKRYVEELNKIKDKEIEIYVAAELGIEVTSDGTPIINAKNKNAYEATYAKHIEEINNSSNLEKMPIYMNPDNMYALTDEEKTANAEYIYGYLKKEGWSTNAICGLLGNIEKECQLNPAGWEGNQKNDPNNYYNGNIGYGLVQWTPASEFGQEDESTSSMSKLDKFAKENPEELFNMQLDFLVFSSQTEDYDKLRWYGGDLAKKYRAPETMTYDEYISSSDNVEKLTLVFHAHYERSADDIDELNLRVEYAQKWEEYFKQYEDSKNGG